MTGRDVKWTVALAVIAVVTLVAGCASLPESSSPQAIGSLTAGAASTTPPQPSPGREPDRLVRDFVTASSSSANRHQAARQFLTSSASSNWDDSAKTVIADKIDLLSGPRTDDEAEFTLRSNTVGLLAPGGDYQAGAGTVDSTIKMTKVDGEWRIDELPPGVILDRSQFFAAYQRQSLFFVDPLGAALVPDVRWVSGSTDQLANQLVQLLIDGPKSTLAPAVSNELGTDIGIRGPITRADGSTSQGGSRAGGVRIDFGGLQSVDSMSRVLLAAQVVWTLASADVAGPYVLLADGQPLDNSKPDGWTTADVESLDPEASSDSDVGLHALVSGQLVSVDDVGTTPVPGYFGSVQNLRSVALSTDGTLVAGVADTGRPAPEPSSTLMIGGSDSGAFPVAEGQSITRPTWGVDNNAAWAVIDGTNVIRAARDPANGQVSVLPVDAGAITALGARITDLRLSRDGVRAAMIVDGLVYVATVVRQANGLYSLLSPKAVANGLGSDALALDWSTGDTVVVVRIATDVPVVQVTTDGSRLDALPSRNLTAPVLSVDASPTTEYVADSRAVFQLNNSDPAGDRYWREVAGLAGVKATPILPG
ncbi:MtrAB system accessory lipoprotein LpqB [Rhodococcus sp. G-MC3]|uniref:MtrAB system accessory lipoprotein LpqB n=1 Tax=Rhodococcus sp. G-MC3 TaxID=3046209 RepID=UPI0024BB6D73|nr:MtrAB system accessory lipoprotein LpqB [Rhodococcus sp. G-MC3]MDJ0395178.1 MtrAB system accessory lipoprotein LpqB [Rhodococcus sp. G-MC3]